MNFNSLDTVQPKIFLRLYSVWYRHFRVYTKNIVSNGIPPFIKPLIFLAGMGLGLGGYILDIENMSYIQYLAIGLPLSSAVFAATFECSIGTFIRLEFAKTYDSMLTGSLSIENLFIGEIIWAGTKSAFYLSAVLFVLLVCHVIPMKATILFTPAIGFIVGVMFAPLSLIFMSFVKSINTLDFYLTGMIMPMLMFSGIIFPIANLPKWMQVIIEIFPLVHAVNIERALCTSSFMVSLIWDLMYCVIFTLVATYIAVRRIKKRLMY
jgi:lipooligosaccharide transport system permease protein